jgi:DNA-binding PadR family transcriptional regulator
MGRHTPEHNPITRQIAGSIADAPGTSDEVIKRLRMEGAKVWTAINSLLQHEWIAPVDTSKRRCRTYKITAAGLEWLGRRPAQSKSGSGVITPLTYRQQLMREILERNARDNPNSKTAGGKCPHADGRSRARNSGASKLRLRQRLADTLRGTGEGVSELSDDCGVV